MTFCDLPSTGLRFSLTRARITFALDPTDSESCFLRKETYFMEDDTTSQAEEPESRAGSPLLRTEARLGAAWVSVTKLSPEFPPPGPGPSRVSDTDSREAHAVIISVSCPAR